MGVWGQMKQWFVLQLLLGFIFLTSGLIICFLMLLTYIFVWPFSKDWYRKICHHLGYLHWCQMTFLGQWWSNSDITLVLENAEDAKYFGKEHTVVIANHRYDIDWLMCWMFAERFKVLGGSKIYGKQPLKYIPIMGWEWIFVECIFLKREWSKDKETLKKDLAYLVEYPPDYWVTLLLFCEGTRFTEDKHAASNEVARKKGIPELKYHLLPRAKGFVLSMQGIKGKIPAVYDLTIGFRNEDAEPTLMNVLNGKSCHAEIYFRRFPTENIPIETDEACSEWLQQMYREKDEIFDDFAVNGTFTKGTRLAPPKRKLDLVIFIFWAILLLVPLFYYLSILFLSGSVFTQVVFVIFVAAMSIGVRMMISVSEIKKGSKYGKKD